MAPTADDVPPEMQRKMARELRATKNIIKNTTKPCPGCKCNIEKNGGWCVTLSCIFGRPLLISIYSDHMFCKPGSLLILRIAVNVDEWLSGIRKCGCGVCGIPPIIDTYRLPCIGVGFPLRTRLLLGLSRRISLHALVSVTWLLLPDAKHTMTTPAELRPPFVYVVKLFVAFLCLTSFLPYAVWLLGALLTLKYNRYQLRTSVLLVSYPLPRPFAKPPHWNRKYCHNLWR